MDKPYNLILEAYSLKMKNEVVHIAAIVSIRERGSLKHNDT